jgi:hypothetical protein
MIEQAQENEDLSDPDYLRQIHQWADSWQAAGWPPMDGAGHGTPRYLLDTYPSTLTEDPPRLAALAGDAGWVTTAIQTLGVDAVLAELKTAVAAAPGEPRLGAMHAVVRGQAHHLRGWKTSGDPGFVPRQLCLQATELGETPSPAASRPGSLPPAILARCSSGPHGGQAQRPRRAAPDDQPGRAPDDLRACSPRAHLLITDGDGSRPLLTLRAT